MRASLFFVSLAAAVTAAVLSLGFFTGYILGIPPRLGLPVVLRLTGVPVMAFGLFILGRLFKYRKLPDFISSTYMTFLKTIRRIPPGKAAGRTEPLVMTGPHGYVRHPAYSAYLLLFFGLWLILDYTPVLFGSVYLFLWFQLVVTPVEEKELRMLFGRQYESYARRVPKFFPAPWRGKYGQER